jgi:hypothetical protein
VTTVDLWYPKEYCSHMPLSRKNHDCSGCIELGTLKLLKFTYAVCTEGLNILKLKTHGVGYITVTKITTVHIKTTHPKLDFIFFSYHDYCGYLTHFSHHTTQLSIKTYSLSRNFKFLLFHTD